MSDQLEKQVARFTFWVKLAIIGKLTVQIVGFALAATWIAMLIGASAKQ